MKKNISKTDRIMRTIMIASFATFILTELAHYPQVYFFEVLIVFLLFTIAIGYCPLYALFGINTYMLNDKHSNDE
ncbi:MAG: DUF2892 domain-containing protein [Ferruginibacter sp.]